MPGPDDDFAFLPSPASPARIGPPAPGPGDADPGPVSPAPDPGPTPGGVGAGQGPISAGPGPAGAGPPLDDAGGHQDLPRPVGEQAQWDVPREPADSARDGSPRVSATAAVPPASRLAPADQAVLPPAAASPQPRVYGRPANGVAAPPAGPPPAAYPVPDEPHRPHGLGGPVAPQFLPTEPPVFPTGSPVVPSGPRSHPPAPLVGPAGPPPVPNGDPRSGPPATAPVTGLPPVPAEWQPPRPVPDQHGFDAFGASANPMIFDAPAGDPHVANPPTQVGVPPVRVTEAEQPAPQVRNGRVLLAVLSAAVLLLVVPLGIVWLVTRSSGPTFEVGSCVRRSGSEAVTAQCTDAGAFTVVGRTDSPDRCTDPPGQPYVVVSDGGRDQVLCLRPAAGR